MSLLTILIFAYFLVNTFIAGYQSAFLKFDKDSKSTDITYLAIVFLTGIIFVLISEVHILLIKFDKLTQITFFFHYLFTKKYKNVPIKDLKIANVSVQHVTGDSAWSDRLVKWCIGLVNKRNNYVHIPPFPGALEEEWAMTDK